MKDEREAILKLNVFSFFFFSKAIDFFPPHFFSDPEMAFTQPEKEFCVLELAKNKSWKLVRHTFCKK